MINLKSIRLVVLFFLLLFLPGCAQLFPQPIKTTTHPDGTKVEEPVTATAGDFFESKNLANFYQAETKRSDSHEKAAIAKISAIQENSVRMLENTETPGERLLVGVVTSQQLANIPTAPPPSGITPPKTLTDVASQQLVSWVGLGLEFYKIHDGSKGNKADSPTLDIDGNGNIINYQSAGSFNPAYSLEEGAVGTFEGHRYNLSYTQGDTSKQTNTSLW